MVQRFPTRFRVHLLGVVRTGADHVMSMMAGVDQDFFHVIEVWVENRLMIEVATPDMVDDYKRMIRRENLDAMFAARAAA